VTYRRSLLASVGLAVFGLALLVAPVAGAEESNRIVDRGWWWRVQSGLLVPMPAPPGVEEGQLVVQSSPEGAQAIAAVSAVLADGQTDPTLVLDVATDGGGATAVVLACRAGSAWVGTDAGRWDSRPQVDCATSVTGVVSEDGSQWTFALSPLEEDGRVDVVLVPGRLADAELAPTFNLVFEEPTGASVTTTAGTTPPAPTAPAPEAPVAPAPAPVSSPGSFSPPAPLPEAPTPVEAVEPALEVDSGARDVAAPVAPQAVTTVSAPEPRTVARLVGAVLLLAGAVGAVLAHRSAGLAGAAATPDVPVVGGLARFRSERTTEPQPVS
jgi:hypothetical protein